MNQFSPIQAVGDAPTKSPTRRALAKQQTRLKVLQAASKLFSEQGYEGATIRDIAAAAGMSTGAVFANFADKSDLFREIIHADMADLVQAMRTATAGGQKVEDGLLKAFMAGYAFYQSQLPLARAAFGVSWAADEGHALRNAPPVAAQMEIVTGLLDAGVARGELAKDMDVKLHAKMLFDAYLSNYAQAIFEGRSLDALQGRARDQIRILLAGARRG